MKYGILLEGEKVKYTKEAKKKMALAFRWGCKTDNVKVVDRINPDGQTFVTHEGITEDISNFRYLNWFERNDLFFLTAWEYWKGFTGWFVLAALYMLIIFGGEIIIDYNMPWEPAKSDSVALYRSAYQKCNTERKNDSTHKNCFRTK